MSKRKEQGQMTSEGRLLIDVSQPTPQMQQGQATSEEEGLEDKDKKETVKERERRTLGKIVLMQSLPIDELDLPQDEQQDQILFTHKFQVIDPYAVMNFLKASSLGAGITESTAGEKVFEATALAAIREQINDDPWHSFKTVEAASSFLRVMVNNKALDENNMYLVIRVVTGVRLSVEQVRKVNMHFLL